MSRLWADANGPRGKLDWPLKPIETCSYIVSPIKAGSENIKNPTGLPLKVLGILLDWDLIHLHLCVRVCKLPYVNMSYNLDSSYPP